VAPTNPNKIVPAGWHVPMNAEWDTLQNYLIANGYNWDGTTTGTTSNKIAKSMAAKTDWSTWTSAGVIGNDLSKNNSSGFSALPSGYRWSDGVFNSFGNDGYWWSATESSSVSTAWYIRLHYAYAFIMRDHYIKNCGFSVRLVKD
jgi:uncharacterized protein (TIGR02145 family)